MIMLPLTTVELAVARIGARPMLLHGEAMCSARSVRNARADLARNVGRALANERRVCISPARAWPARNLVRRGTCTENLAGRSPSLDLRL